MVIRLVLGPDLATVLFLEGHEIVLVVEKKEWAIQDLNL